MGDSHVSVRISEGLRSRLNLASEVIGRKPSDLVREAIKEKCDEVLAGQPLSVILRDYIGALESEEPGNSARSREIYEEYLDKKYPRPRK